MLRVLVAHPKHRTFLEFPPYTIAQFTASTLTQEPLRVIAARNLTQSSPSFSIDNPVGLNPKAFLKCANSFLGQSRKLAVNFSAIVLGNFKNFLNSSDCFPRTAESEYGHINWSFSIKHLPTERPDNAVGRQEYPKLKQFHSKLNCFVKNSFSRLPVNTQLRYSNPKSF